MIPLSFISVSVFSDNMLLLLSLLVFVSLLITKIGYKFGMPLLLLFLIVGMLAGEDVLGLKFDNFETAQSIGQFAITIILLTGGLETDIKRIRPVMVQGVLLSTLGVLLTIAFTAAFIYFASRQMVGSATASVLGCILLASVMASTDSASVFSILRDSKIRLKENLGPVLELESGSNDPMAYVMTIMMVSMISNLSKGGMDPSSISTGAMVWHGVGMLFMQITIGFAAGYLIGRAAIWLLRRVELNGSPLYSIMILTIGFFTNGFSSMIGGNGLLALYVVAVTMGNEKRMPYRKEILKFLDGVTWIAQLMMFLMLGLLANPTDLPSAFIPALLIGGFMMLVARPLSVFICLAPFRKMSYRAKLFTSWVGLKGAGPILFSIAPVVAGLEGSESIFNVVFVITLLSLLVQGMTLTSSAKLLKLNDVEEAPPQTFGMELPDEMGKLTDYTLEASDLESGSTLRDLHMPHGTRVMMIKRGEEFIVPHGSLKLYPGDHLVILLGGSVD
ncbi:MAG: potassium/proton antiporter [Bacteroidales bacterium]|nr:potassium/proton antiporter [Bacteroidales bacterium]